MSVNNLIPTNWASFEWLHNVIKVFDKASSEQLRNISVCEITSNVKLINALDAETTLQLLFEDIQNVECFL